MKLKFPSLLLLVFVSFTAFDGCEEDVVLGGGGSNNNNIPDSSNQDLDDDGLSDSVEALSSVGTLRATADSDLDGFGDGLEYALNSGDPLSGNISPNPENRARSLAEVDIVTNETDADGDGLGRTFEEVNELDDNNYDIDGDGYSDAIELLNGSNPFVASSVPIRTQPPANDGSVGVETTGDDFDRDGLSGRLENFEGTNPSDADTDGDGFSDGIEFLMGSSALDPQRIPNFNVPSPPESN